MTWGLDANQGGMAFPWALAPMYGWLPHFSPLDRYSYREPGPHAEPILTIFPAYAWLLICIWLVDYTLSTFYCIQTKWLSLRVTGMHDSLGHNMHKKVLKKFFLFFTFTVLFFCFQGRKEGKRQKRECSTPDLSAPPFFCSPGKGDQPHSSASSAETARSMALPWFPRSCHWTFLTSPKEVLAQLLRGSPGSKGLDDHLSERKQSLEGTKAMPL